MWKRTRTSGFENERLGREGNKGSLHTKGPKAKTLPLHYQRIFRPWYECASATVMAEGNSCRVQITSVHASCSFHEVRNMHFGSRLIERLQRSPPVTANRVRLATRSLSDLRACELSRMMLLVGGFPRGALVSPPLHSGAVPYSPHFKLIGSQDPVVDGPPNPLQSTLNAYFYGHQEYAHFTVNSLYQKWWATSKQAAATGGRARGRWPTALQKSSSRRDARKDVASPSHVVVTRVGNWGGGGGTMFPRHNPVGSWTRTTTICHSHRFRNTSAATAARMCTFTGPPMPFKLYEVPKCRHYPICTWLSYTWLNFAMVAERLTCSPPKAMPLVDGFSRGSPVSLALSFQRCFILTSVTLIGSEDLDPRRTKQKAMLIGHEETRTWRVVVMDKMRRESLLTDLARPLAPSHVVCQEVPSSAYVCIVIQRATLNFKHIHSDNLPKTRTRQATFYESYGKLSPLLVLGNRGRAPVYGDKTCIWAGHKVTDGSSWEGVGGQWSDSTSLPLCGAGDAHRVTPPTHDTSRRTKRGATPRRPEWAGHNPPPPFPKHNQTHSQDLLLLAAMKTDECSWRASFAKYMPKPSEVAQWYTLVLAFWTIHASSSGPAILISGLPRFSEVTPQDCWDVSEDIWAARNSEVLRADEGHCGEYGATPGRKERRYEQLQMHRNLYAQDTDFTHSEFACNMPGKNGGAEPGPMSPPPPRPSTTRKVRLCRARGGRAVARSPPTKVNRVQTPAGSLRIFACGNRAGQRWSAGFLGDISFPPPFYSGAAPSSPHFTLIGSQYLVKSSPNGSTLHPTSPFVATMSVERFAAMHYDKCIDTECFLGDILFAPPLHSGAAPYSPQSPLSALKTSLQIIKLNVMLHLDPFTFISYNPEPQRIGAALRNGALRATTRSQWPTCGIGIRILLYSVTTETLHSLPRRSDEALGVRVIAPSLLDLGRGARRQDGILLPLRANPLRLLGKKTMQGDMHRCKERLGSHDLHFGASTTSLSVLRASLNYEEQRKNRQQRRGYGAAPDGTLQYASSDGRSLYPSRMWKGGRTPQQQTAGSETSLRECLLKAKELASPVIMRQAHGSECGNRGLPAEASSTSIRTPLLRGIMRVRLHAPAYRFF
ncbi:hypothetical protein PR048_003007, partial [Dryococelus australis]